MPCEISSRAMSAWMSEKPIAKSGFSFRISPILALVNAETFGFSLRARGGLTVKPEMPTMRSCSPSAYSTSVGSSVRQTMRRGPCIASVSDKRDAHLAHVRRTAVFPQIYALPGAQRQFAIPNRNTQTDAGEDRAHVRGHVIRPFCVVSEQRIAVAYQSGEVAFEIVAHHGISVLADQQRATGVMHEHLREPRVDAAGRHDFAQSFAHVGETATRGMHREAGGECARRRLCVAHGYSNRLRHSPSIQSQRMRSFKRCSCAYQNSTILGITR